MYRKILLAIIFIFCTSISLVGQTVEQTAAWWVGKPISDFQFEGLKNIQEGQLNAFKSQYIGKLFSDDLYLEIYSTLSALDYFERFEVLPVDPTNPDNIARIGDKEQVILYFKVYENPILDNIFIEGNASIRKTDLLSKIISVVGDPFKRSNLRVDRKAIQLVYAEAGYPNTVVKSRFELDEEGGRAVIFFTIEEGIKRVVSDIAFVGNTIFTKLKLRSTIELKPQTLVEKGIFEEAILETDITAIETLYREKGYIEAKVTNVKKVMVHNKEENQEEYSLIFEIDEGQLHYFGGFSFYGNKIFSEEHLRRLVGLDAGDVLNMVALERGIMMVQQLYFADGYIYNEFTPFEMPSEDGTIISYKMTIQERPRAHIESITISGLSRTKEEVVLRELPFAEGDVFSNSRLMQGLGNLQRLGIFEKVDRKIEMGSAPGLMNLIIVITEGRSTDIQFGLNFSESIYDEIPINFFLQWQEKNLAGNAQTLGVGTELNGNTQRISLNFQDNWVGGERLSMGATVGFEHNQRSYVYQDQKAPVGSGLPDPYEGTYYFSDDITVDGVEYKAGDMVQWDRISQADIDEYGLVTDYDYYSYIMGEPVSSDFLMQYRRISFYAGTNVGYGWSTPVGLFSISSGITFSLEHNSFDSTMYRPMETWLQEHNQQWVWTNRWTTQLTLDSRNHPYHPTEGFLIKQVFTYTGGILLGDTHYNKSRTTVEYYKTLFDIPVADEWSYKTVFAFHSSFHLFLDQYFLDFVGNDIKTFTGTRDRLEDKLYTDRMNIMRGWNNRTDLEAIWETWVELRMPIYEQFVWADLFFEVTGVWNDLADMAPKTTYPHQTLANNFYFTMGGGFRLTLDGFPIAFYLTKGFQIDYLNGEPVIDWQRGEFANPDNSDDGGFNFVFRLMYSY